MPSVERIAYGHPDAPYRTLFVLSIGIAGGVLPVLALAGLLFPDAMTGLLPVVTLPLLFIAIGLAAYGAYRGFGVATSSVVAIGPLLAHTTDFAFRPVLEGTLEGSVLGAVRDWVVVSLALAAVVGVACFAVGSGLRVLHRQVAPPAAGD